MKNLIIILVVICLVGCGKLSLYNQDRGELLASVGDRELYASDLTHIYTQGVTVEDSIAMVESYINQWVRNQVKSLAAEAAFEENPSQIESMIRDYRNSLIGYKFESDYVDSRLDTVVTQDQITKYYEANRANFRLSGPVVKARVARIPATVRNFNKLTELFKSDKEQAKSDFQSICEKNNYQLDDFTGEWTDFSFVIRHIPFTDKNFDEFLKAKRYYEVEDDQNRYMMTIESFRPTGDYSPQVREMANIRKILLNQRRSELLKQLEDSLYNQAQTQKQINIRTR